ncbi:glycosyltransferase family 4 protein [Serratia proteamaculans]|uniref:glycosyltransferase family 4 protein n=1 Tax=Serratia proteamaculans TaxID=28151 RepID=UPI0021771C9F|nr:glycosyltransferase family 4 protein [Serratia proteamaculans]CAI0794187.1 Glycogen synthase [Serratia proteamaculans]
MRVIIVNTLYYPYKVGGAEVSVQLLAEELVRKGHQVRVVCLHRENDRKKDNINGVDVVYLPLKNIYWPFCDDVRSKVKRLLWHAIDSYNIFMASSLSREIDEFNPDVVHTNNISGFSVSIWNAIKKRNKKLIHTTRDYYLFHPNSTMFSQDKNMDPDEGRIKFWSFGKKLASRKVDTYIGISDFIRKFHVENGFFVNATSDYIYNAVEKIPVKDIKSTELRFGFIGRLTRDKGFDTYCQLVDRFREKYPNAIFYAAGRFIKSEDGDVLEKLANQKGILLLGFIPSNQFLSLVDVVVLPIKWREPFGRVVIESVLANKIVLTNAVGGVSELEKLFPTIVFIEDLNAVSFCEKNNVVINGEIFNCSEIANKYIEVYREK